MRRRNFLRGLGSAAAWPLAARAQRGERTRRVGVLNTARDPQNDSGDAVFVKTLQDLGWKIGGNLVIDYRAAAGDTARAQTIAKELLGLGPDVVMATGITAVAALRAQTSSVPIVFVRVSDPVGRGFVDGLARPGGNVTGFSNFDLEMGGKWLQILKEMVPATTRAVVIGNPRTSALDGYFQTIAAGGNPLGIESVRAPVFIIDEMARAIALAGGRPGGGLIAVPDGFTVDHRAAFIEQANRQRVPAIYAYRFFANEGGLVAYGVDADTQYRGAASYVDRILKGAVPADLPVQRPTKFELVVNLKTAKALGLTVPDTLLARADEAIE
jgi:putative ABC transport system substrate-binding protein